MTGNGSKKIGRRGDAPVAYGLFARCLHWGMALLLLWQFMTSTLHWVDSKASLAASLFPSHRVIGFLILLLIVVRIGWSIADRHNRPARTRDMLGRSALVVQVAMYALMLAVPAIALIRAYASGRGFDWLGLSVIPATGERQVFAASLMNTLHGPLGWLFYFLIFGHSAMALVHHFILRDASLARMMRLPR
jgi:cytochrome b561